MFFRFVVSIRSKNFGLRHAPFDRKNLVTFTFRGYLQALQRGTKRSSLAIGQHFQDFSFRGVCFSMLQKEWINVGRLRKQLSFPSTFAFVNYRTERFVLGLHFILNRLLQLAWECCEASNSTSRAVEWPGSGCVWRWKLVTVDDNRW